MKCSVLLPLEREKEKRKKGNQPTRRPMQKRKAQLVARLLFRRHHSRGIAAPGSALDIWPYVRSTCCAAPHTVFPRLLDGVAAVRRGGGGGGGVYAEAGHDVSCCCCCRSSCAGRSPTQRPSTSSTSRPPSPDVVIASNVRVSEIEEPSDRSNQSTTLGFVSILVIV